LLDCSLDLQYAWTRFIIGKVRVTNQPDQESTK
jgi:hypothetical protein